MTVGRTSHSQSRRALLLLLALISFGCGAGPAEPTDPPIVGDPLPGSFYLTSDQPAPYPLTIRQEAGTRSAQFDEGDSIVVNWSDLPLPPQKRIEINGQHCEGTFDIQARIETETDLLLSLTDNGCRIEVLGSHPEGGSHAEEPEPYGSN
jgi:hypothetical protein